MYQTRHQPQELAKAVHQTYQIRKLRGQFLNCRQVHRQALCRQFLRCFLRVRHFIRQRRRQPQALSQILRILEGQSLLRASARILQVHLRYCLNFQPSRAVLHRPILDFHEILHALYARDAGLSFTKTCAAVPSETPSRSTTSSVHGWTAGSIHVDSSA